VTSDVDSIRELNDVVAGGDIRGFTEHMHPDAVWEHNPGTGSPEEGVYEGREQIGQLFERILEEPYEQRLEIRDGRMAKCRMVVGSPLRG
jgi:ketosteroid isomerase-like protein